MVYAEKAWGTLHANCQTIMIHRLCGQDGKRNTAGLKTTVFTPHSTLRATNQAPGPPDASHRGFLIPHVGAQSSTHANPFARQDANYITPCKQPKLTARNETAEQSKTPHVARHPDPSPRTHQDPGLRAKLNELQDGLDDRTRLSRPRWTKYHVRHLQQSTREARTVTGGRQLLNPPRKYRHQRPSTDKITRVRRGHNTLERSGVYPSTVCKGTSRLTPKVPKADSDSAGCPPEESTPLRRYDRTTWGAVDYVCIYQQSFDSCPSVQCRTKRLPVQRTYRSRLQQRQMKQAIATTTSTREARVVSYRADNFDRQGQQHVELACP